MSTLLLVATCIAGYGVGAGLTAGILWVFYALENDNATLDDLFWGNSAGPFFSTLFWPIGLPLLVTFYGFTKLACVLVDIAHRRAERIETEDKLRKLELVQAEKEVEKLLANG